MSARPSTVVAPALSVHAVEIEGALGDRIAPAPEGAPLAIEIALREWLDVVGGRE